MSDRANPWIHLASNDLCADIDPHGAQLSVLRSFGGEDLLWDGDPKVWAGRAPLLFPIVGVLVGGRYRVGTKIYDLPRHGFARGRGFSLIQSTPTVAQFRLSADDESLKIYPFLFQLDIHFLIDGPTLTVTSTVRNKGEVEMPASFGYHPAFRWPLPFGQSRSSHYIEFEHEEHAPVRRLDSAGFLTPEHHPTPVVHRRLTLNDDLFLDDVLIFDQLKSRAVIYGSEQGARLRVAFPDAPYLGLWTKPGAPFICIEPWHGITDLQGFSDDFSQKTGIFILMPGATLTTTMAISLLNV